MEGCWCQHIISQCWFSAWVAQNVCHMKKTWWLVSVSSFSGIYEWAWANFVDRCLVEGTYGEGHWNPHLRLHHACLQRDALPTMHSHLTMSTSIILSRASINTALRCLLTSPGYSMTCSIDLLVLVILVTCAWTLQNKHFFPVEAWRSKGKESLTSYSLGVQCPLVPHQLVTGHWADCSYILVSARQLVKWHHHVNWVLIKQ